MTHTRLHSEQNTHFHFVPEITLFAFSVDKAVCGRSAGVMLKCLHSFARLLDFARCQSELKAHGESVPVDNSSNTGDIWCCTKASAP
jgi:hypothetical protein